jgi:hypothetical protein
MLQVATVDTFILNVTNVRGISALSEGFSFLFCGTAGVKRA